MINDLFLNACILVAFISGSHQIFKDKGLHNTSLLKTKIFAGILSGILGTFLMIYSVQLNEIVILDFRNIPILISAIYGGIIPPITSSLIIGSFRLAHFGINKASITACVILALIAFGCGLYSYNKVSRKKKWIFCVSYELIISNMAIAYLIGDTEKIINTLPAYNIGTILVSILSHRYTEYLSASSRLLRKLKEESRKDFLTDLNNVRSFDNIFNQIVHDTTEKQGSFSLLFIDIDFFKKVNDTYGHQNGDIVLRKLGHLLKETISDCGIVSRNGGEEFSILLTDCSSEEAIEVAEKIRKKVEAEEFSLLDNTIIHITVSIGISNFPGTTNKPEQLLGLADSALYEAKHTGRNKVVLFKDKSQPVPIYCQS
jgi:diguanylate cyclase